MRSIAPRLNFLTALLLTFAPNIPAATTIFAGTSLGPVVSPDGGATWAVVAVNLNSGLLTGQPTFYSLAVDPKTPSNWYAIGSASGAFGLYKSINSGQTWTATPFITFQPSLSSGAIAIDPVTTSTLYVIGNNTSAHNFVERSTDSGATWTKLKLPVTIGFPTVSFPDGPNVTSLTTDPKLTGIVYAVAGHYLFRSLDFGATWTVLSTGVDTPERNNQEAGAFPPLSRLEVDPRISTMLYASSGASFKGPNCKGTPAGGECGLYKSIDNGVTWTQLGIPSPATDSLSIDPVSGALYAGAVLTESSGAIFKSTDNGVTWTPLKNPFSLRGPLVRVDPGNPSTIYAFAHTGSGISNSNYYKSTDSGATWTTLNTPLLCPVTTPKCAVFSPPTFNDLVLVPPPAVPTPAPAISANGVVNGASFLPGIVPNSWASILGTNLSPVTDDWSKSIVNGQFPTTLDGVTVTIGGKQAYLNYITPNQLNFLVPDVGVGSMQVTVTTPAGTSAAFTVNSGQYAPAFFSWPNNQAVATQRDFSFAVKSGTFAGLTTTAARPGDVLILWGTGFGPTTPVPPAGTAVPTDKTYAPAMPTVTINGIPATVYGAALAPGFAGLYQVAIQVPATLGNGDWPIQANVAGASSPPGAVLSVHQ